MFEPETDSEEVEENYILLYLLT